MTISGVDGFDGNYPNLKIGTCKNTTSKDSESIFIKAGEIKDETLDTEAVNKLLNSEETKKIMNIIGHFTKVKSGDESPYIEGTKKIMNKIGHFTNVKSGDESPYIEGTKQITNKNLKGVTNKDTGYTIEKDKDGNTICRVDYNNNNPEIAPFDEEEVRTPEGKLKSFTERSYSGDGERNYYKKYEYDKNEKLVKITMTTCDASGKVLKSENLKIEDEPDVKLHVSLGRAIDGEGGDTELQKILADNGFTEIGNH